VLIIASAPIYPNTPTRDVINAFVFSFNILAGIVLLKAFSHLRAQVLRLIGICLILLQFGNLFYSSFELIDRLIPILYLVFFVAISYQVYRGIYLAKHIDTEMLSAVFCGFVLLGLLSTFIFLFIELSIPGSFRGLAEDSSPFDNFIYFSFITLLTIGFGDITPATDLSKILTVILGIIGQFYTVIVVGVIIGKYLMRTPNENTYEK
jgi:hypothetical protein